MSFHVILRDLRIKFMTDRDYIINRVKEAVFSFQPDADLLLYGSRARGTVSAESDWDFLILTDTDLDNLAKREIRSKIYKIEIETGEVISVIIHSRSYWNSPRNAVTPFYKNIGRESISL